MYENLPNLLQKKMSLREFIKQNRSEINAAIKRVVPNAQLNDNERRLWMMRVFIVGHVGRA